MQNTNNGERAANAGRSRFGGGEKMKNDDRGVVSQQDGMARIGPLQLMALMALMLCAALVFGLVGGSARASHGLFKVSRPADAQPIVPPAATSAARLDGAPRR
jgi:hypothetical protein